MTAACSGVPLDLTQSSTDPRAKLTSAEVDGWVEDQAIPAEALRTALRELAGQAVDPHGLHIRHARVDGDLDLAWMTVLFPLWFKQCYFPQFIEVRDSRFAQLGLTGSLCAGISADRMRIDGGAFWQNLTATGEVRAVGARITGQLVLADAILTNPDGTALNFDGARIDGSASWQNLTATGEVRALGARITGQLDLANAILTNPDGNALSLDRTQIDGGASWQGLTAVGEVRALGAHIAGQLVLADATLTNPDGDALTLDWAQIDGGASWKNLTTVGEVRALGAHITGEIVLADATLTNPDGDALCLDGAHIDGGAFWPNLTTTGQVRALGAHITGQLSLQGATLANETGPALNLNGARIEGGAFWQDLTATGQVRALRAHIAGQFALTRATLTNPGGVALTLDGARIDGSTLWHDLTATGQVRAAGANLAGQFTLARATLTNPGGDALTLDRAQIHGDALWQGLTAIGRVRALGAHITGQLDLSDATLLSPEGDALALDGAQVGHFILAGTDIDGSLVLTAARIDVLETHGRLSAGLEATGWKLGDIHGTVRDNWRAAKDWLDASPGFASQPWHEMAACFERAGQPVEARLLRLTAARRTTRHAPWYGRPSRWLYGGAVGHGYQPLRAAAWLTLVTLLALALTLHSPQAFGPTDITRAVTEAELQADPRPPAPTGATPCSQLKPGQPCFQPVHYAFTIALPIAVAPQIPAWQPTTTAMSVAISTLRVLGWVMTALLLAGVTGLLRRT